MSPNEKGVASGIITPETTPTEWVQVAEVDSLYMYPMKSGKAVQIEEAEVLGKKLIFSAFCIPFDES